MSVRARGRIPYARFALLIALNVLALLAEKMAAMRAGGSGFVFYAHLVLQGWMWVGIGLALLQLWVWMGILACTELSLAFPISSLCYPLTMLAAWVVFREQLNGWVWAGALLITLGVVMVTSTARQPLAESQPASQSAGHPERG